MTATDWAQALSVGFAAVAALAGLAAVVQTRSLHREDEAARALDREERQQQFEHESAERGREFAAEMHLRRLEQIGRVSDLVAQVREVARQEENPTQGGRIATHLVAPFYWNARMQLATGIAVLTAMGGPDLPACRDLATGSAMEFLSQAVGGATSAFAELERVVGEMVSPT